MIKNATQFLLVVLILCSVSNVRAEKLINELFYGFEADEILGISGSWSLKSQFVITDEKATSIGGKSMKCTFDANIGSNIQTTSPSGSIVMDNGMEYTISMKVLVPAETTLSGFQFMIGKTLKLVSISFADEGIVKDGTWQTISFPYTAPVDIHEGGRLGFRALKNLDESGSFYIDDIMIEGEIPSCGLPGFDFDPDALTWSVPAGELSNKPNILVIMTDEHSIRTIGAYRDLMTDDQAYIWGDDVKVETPNLNKLASQGALCTKYYASSPSCTPSRGSFLTGLSPYIHRAHKNDMQMNVNVVTMGEYFKQKGYNTSYIGKWHLNEVTDENVNDYAISPSFGFDDNTYMYHKAHPKWAEYIDRSKKGKDEEFVVIPHTHSSVTGQLPAEGKDIVYYTEFLGNNTLKILDEVKDDENPFCMMVSIPDPHTPDVCHANYYNKYTDVPFEQPLTQKKPIELKQKWANGTSKLDQSEFDDLAKDNMAQYFGMVEYIDDQVGRILDYLDANNLTDNTIVVFTADHGDMLYEHQRIDKGLVFEASAAVPFIIRYPNVIPEGKVITTPQVNTDFMPTLLGMIDAPKINDIHGEDLSGIYTGEIADQDRDVYLRFISGSVVATVNSRYKLLIANNERPWLFDLEEDPYELVNYYDDPSYENIFNQMMTTLINQADYNQDPALSTIPSNKKVSNSSKIDVDKVIITNKILKMKVGEKANLFSLVTAFNPDEYASIKTVEWSSSDTDVATIDSNSPITGELIAIKGGETTITVTSIDGLKQDSYLLTVEADAPTKTKVVFNDENVVISPNPFDNFLRVNFKGEHSYERLVVYNLSGSISYQQSIGGKQTIELNGSSIGAFGSGVYLIKLIGKNEIYATKIIKK